MDPRDLPALVEPIARDEADYVKGNRFTSRAVVRAMPPSRLLGGLAVHAPGQELIPERVQLVRHLNVVLVAYLPSSHLLRLLLFPSLTVIFSVLLGI